ncbi:MAG: phage holin family protein [Moraxellaceae bacterium]|nr:phage holin family protein [Moraxellaceae bacterium]
MMMYHMIIRLLLSACGLGLADYLLDGVRFDHFSTLFWAALLLGSCQ